MLTFITGNVNKVREFERILGYALTHTALDLDEIQAVDLLPVIEHKARHAYAALGRPVLVEDTGLAFAAWNGLPGALIKWFLTSVGVEGICQMLQGETNRAASATILLGYCDGKDVQIFPGSMDGVVPTTPHGESGFGWDAIFQPHGSRLTFAEMDPSEKDRFSMRRIALEALQQSGLISR